MDDLISRQAAIDALEDYTDSNTLDGYEDSRTLIEILKALPSAQPEPCDDPRADVYYLAEKIGIHRLYALVVELRGEPEPCEDAQHILDYLDNVLHPLVSPEHWNVYSELHDMIAALPSAQPEQRWIPVTERLPEYGKSVLCYFKEDEDFSVNHVIDEEDGEWFINGVTAWMPLPEPYREE